MDILVKLWLQGGHKWEFCCDEDDPIIVGLMSALPGAELAGNLPADGLIQLETRTGERLFLTRSSLVSIALVPVTDDLQLLHANRLVAPSTSIHDELSKPAPFVMVPDAFPTEVHRALIGHALDAEEALPQDRSKNEIRELSLGPLQERLAKALRSQVERSLAQLGIADPPGAPIQLRLFAIGNGGSISWDAAPKEAVSLVYHFHKQPKAFTGGGVRLFDSKIANGVSSAAAFRDMEIGDNATLIFPGDVVRAGLPVQCASRTFADSLFVLQGSLGAGE